MQSLHYLVQSVDTYQKLSMIYCKFHIFQVYPSFSLFSQFTYVTIYPILFPSCIMVRTQELFIWVSPELGCDFLQKEMFYSSTGPQSSQSNDFHILDAPRGERKKEKEVREGGRKEKKMMLILMIRVICLYACNKIILGGPKSPFFP